MRFAIIWHSALYAAHAATTPATRWLGVTFIEVEAIMRLVNDSIRQRREFRLAEVEQLLFGN
ncbi:MAG TPA: hypothetical protein VJ783_22105 [Pirellulales bacterium]|nr:hypothetical protein [Pirellulales bacterium]